MLPHSPNGFKPEPGMEDGPSNHCRCDENKQNASNTHACTRAGQTRSRKLNANHIRTQRQRRSDGVDNWNRSRWCGAHRYLPVFCSFQHISPGSLQRRTGYIPSSLAVSSVHSISPLPCDLFNYFSPSLPFCRSLHAAVTAGCPCIGCVLDGRMDGWRDVSIRNGRLCWKP